MLILHSTIHVSVIFPLKGESSTTPLIIFLVCVLYFVICFQTVPQTSANAPSGPGVGPTGHRTYCTTWHTSQATCHSKTLVICFILFLYCTQLINHVTNGFHHNVHALNSHFVFSLPVLTQMNKKKFPPSSDFTEPP